VVVLAVAANTLATSFGVGKQVDLVSSLPGTPALPDRIVLYSNEGFLVAGPQRDGDVPGLLRALRRDGVQVVTFSPAESAASDFSAEGIFPLAMIAGLSASYQTALVRTSPAAVALVHQSISSKAPPTCTRLSDGTGVWVVRLNQAAGKLAFYCPYRHPQFYK
jgi:hypothetical protein